MRFDGSGNAKYEATLRGQLMAAVAPQVAATAEVKWLDDCLAG